MPRQMNARPTASKDAIEAMLSAMCQSGPTPDQTIDVDNWLKMANPVVRVSVDPATKRVKEAWVLLKDLHRLDDNWKVAELNGPAPYKIIPVEGKGRGMVTTRNFKSNELVLAERPIILIPMVTTDRESLSTFLTTTWLLRALYRLEQDDREKVLQLSDCKPQDRYGPLAGLFYTNCITASFFSSNFWSDYSGICLDLSYANHGCDYNTMVIFDEKSGHYLMRAVRDISVGEELTYPYVDPHVSRDERRKLTRDGYGFDCACSRCSAPQSVVDASDKRQAFIWDTLKIEGGLSAKWLSCAPYARAVRKKRDLKIMREVLKAAEEEDSYLARKMALYELVNMYGILGDAKNFKESCREYMKIWDFEGQIGVSDEMWEGWIKNPRSFPTWGYWL